MKLFGSTESKITKDKNGQNMSHLEITKVLIVHYNIVNKNFCKSISKNDYQQDSRVLYTFASNKSFDQLLDISPNFYIFNNI